MDRVCLVGFSRLYQKLDHPTDHQNGFYVGVRFYVQLLLCEVQGYRVPLVWLATADGSGVCFQQVGK